MVRSPVAEVEQTFGTMLARLRRKAGLTQEELAQQAGLSTRGVGNLERDVGRPRMYTVERLVAALDLAEDDRAELMGRVRSARRAAIRGSADPADGRAAPAAGSRPVPGVSPPPHAAGTPAGRAGPPLADRAGIAGTLRASAARARDDAHHDEAAHLLYQLLDLLTGGGATDAERGEVALELARELSAAGRYDAALAAAERALDAYRHGGDRSRQDLATAHIGYLYFRRGDPREGLARVTAALDNASRPRSAARLHLALACNLFSHAYYEQAIEVSAEAIELAARDGDDDTLAASQLRRGLSRRMLGDSEAALTDLHSSAALAELCDSDETLIRALTGIAVVHHYNGELQRADAHFRRTRQLAESQGDAELFIRATANCGASAFWLGRWGTARAFLERSTAMAETIGPSAAGPLAVVGHAELLAAAERGTDALQLLARARRLATPEARLEMSRDAAAVEAELHLRADRPAAAVGVLEPLLDRPGLREWGVVDLLPLLAESQLAGGDAAAAAGTATHAVSRARSARHALALVEALRVTALVTDGPVAAQALDEGLRLARAMPNPQASRRLHAAGAVLARRRHDAVAAGTHDRCAARLRTALLTDLRA